LHVILSIGLGILLFSIIFKQLPEIRLRWGDVTLAAALTSFIFTLLNYLFGVYLSLFSATTLAGTAGALMLLFFWIYLTSLFLLFGVQFSKAYAEKMGSLSKFKVKVYKHSDQQIKKVTAKVNLEWTINKNNSEGQE